MKIAYILPSLDNRGPIIFTKYLIESLKNFDVEIHVYYFKDSANPLDLEVPSFKISLFKYTLEDTYDVIHSTMLMPDLYMYLHRKRIKSRAVISMHNMITEDLNFNYSLFKYTIYNLIWKFILNRNVPIIVSSEEMKQYYIDKLSKCVDITKIPYGINKKKYTAINNSADIEIITALKRKYKIIGSVGLTIKRKGFIQLVDFLSINSEFAVVIIGDGEDKENLLSYAFELGVQDRFIILGFRDNAYNYYRYFDIYAMTSYSEGFGLAMIEAMSHELPIVCSKLQLYDEYFSDNDVSFFEPDNIESLVQAFSKIVSNIDYYKQKSINLYYKNFSLEKMGKHHMSFYNNLF